MLFSLLSVGYQRCWKVREASFERTKASSWYTSVSLEFINGIRTVHSQLRTLSADGFMMLVELLKAATKSVSAIALIEPLSEGASTTILVGMLILAFATLIPNGELQSAVVTLFVLLRIMPIVRHQWSQHSSAISAAEQY